MSEPTFREKRGHASWRKVDATGTSRFSQQFKGVQTDASKLFKIIQDREQPSQKRVSALVSWIGPGRDARSRIKGNIVVTNLLQNLIKKIRTLRTLNDWKTFMIRCVLPIINLPFPEESKINLISGMKQKLSGLDLPDRWSDIFRWVDDLIEKTERERQKSFILNHIGQEIAQRYIDVLASRDGQRVASSLDQLLERVLATEGFTQKFRAQFGKKVQKKKEDILRASSFQRISQSGQEQKIGRPASRSSTQEGYSLFGAPHPLAHLAFSMGKIQDQRQG